MLALPLPWRRIGHAVADPALATTVAGVPLANPIGLASGFDKACERFAPLGALGFGYVGRRHGHARAAAGERAARGSRATPHAARS